MAVRLTSFGIILQSLSWLTVPGPTSSSRKQAVARCLCPVLQHVLLYGHDSSHAPYWDCRGTYVALAILLFGS